MTAARPQLKKEAVRGSLVGPDGLADVVPTDQGSVPSLRRIAMYARRPIRAIGSPHFLVFSSCSSVTYQLRGAAIPTPPE
jgi:hypothetical protein